MAEIRLARLPDRTPVKITIRVPPALNQALTEYAALYEEVYERAEPLQDLIPAMLAGFLDADRLFARRRSRGK